jgi:ketosteroid isomerase-like protein
MSYRVDRAAFEVWLEAYKAAWETRDSARAAALFTEDAIYRETPFDPPLRGRAAIADYWTRVTGGQRDIRFTWEIFGCEGAVGLCRWHAAFTGIPGGESIDLDGVFRCTFAGDRLVSVFEEWWHIKVEPAAAASPME